MHDLTANIHNRMDHLNDHGNLNFEQYNSLREKLSQVSALYRKKYPNCLPLPIQLIDKEEELNEEQEVQECKYAFHLGYNYVLNWLLIINPLQMEQLEAWAKIKDTAGYAFDAFLQSEQRNRTINFRLSGKCFAKGMKTCFVRNFDKAAKKEQVEGLENPRRDLKSQMRQMRDLYGKIQQSLQQS